MSAGSVGAPLLIPLRTPPPGKNKHEIDTCTPVQIKSDRADVSIFYTLDGSKPEAVRRPGLGDRSTLTYTEPILLPAGKVHVRVVAVSSDGRQSSIVTKVFMVEQIPTETQESTRDDKNQQNNSEQHKLTGAVLEQESSTGASSSRHLDIPAGGARQTRKTQRLKRAADALPTPHTQAASRLDTLLRSSTSTPAPHIQRQTDFLRCSKCLSPRSSDPFARFCLHCGAATPPVPGHTHPPADGERMVVCMQCKNMVPNTLSCVVCEAPVAQQLHPQTGLMLQDQLTCHSCGTGNPAPLTHCVTCEAELLQDKTPSPCGQRAAPLPCPRAQLVSCSTCSRVNLSDARFCDWCGAKPGHVASPLTCSRCRAMSPPYSNYCGGCGVFLEGPARASGRDVQPSAAGGALEPEQSDTEAVWRSVSCSVTDAAPSAAVPVCADAQTQTVGLFYPSSTQLQRQSQHREAERHRPEQMSDRKPLLTAISPGRGFWRKQLDHVCAHMRSYTQNSSEFRALVGEPRMGRSGAEETLTLVPLPSFTLQLASASVEETSDEVCLHLRFVSAATDRPQSSAAAQLNGSASEPLELSNLESSLGTTALIKPPQPRTSGRRASGFDTFS